jgi:diaminopimelate epimerase
VTREIPFTKGHGTQNHFVLLLDADGGLELPPETVVALCDRHAGFATDGVIRVVRSAALPDGKELADTAEWFMDYRNADGSIAEMCGNGVRVFTRYLVANGLGAPDLPIATRAGVVRAVVDADTISVRMPSPRVYAASTATVGSLTVPGVAVDCGNPHLVCAVPDVAGLDLRDPPAYDTALFPAGVNVEFSAPAGAALHVRMRVHERGSGETLSCGSGALAVGAVALRDAGVSSGTVTVDVPGGRLTVTRDGDDWWLAGPAVLVATGEVDVAALA